ncbi:sentrin-specific protease 8 [Marchantia polymorpha subsp. ruderalis]|uniref:Ubiquitin-like protease family profile domain-containing protein n=2 Tax=Marchantia polymorpha TaxID=3197 RepID=A0A176VQU3_MARPO|nr:hypothetical protein AXG93_412s1150 [Marchantia polymorpha subsp. ruderalis]PTQ46914.1 hypothetical protein MARPO_0009s0037 [Marchantia polymorpha]BBN17309.1 hypothetical protein Mp_7g13510 [Marchantia polymorpha subsp. ruderalis]|eukprot:PTQ46914.1 hypothetical protein MARPO_0009s0037 [Marchantia polymorpha]
MGASDQRVLSYGDVLLRVSDVSLLDGPHYLNDHIIEFFFNYLDRQFCSFTGCHENETSPLLLVGPTLTFWLLHCPDSEGLLATIQPMSLHEREMVIFAVNNNEDVETAEGGTHWTLLMYNRQRNTFEHFDSMAGTNWKQARDLVHIIKPFMGPVAASAKFIEQATPQQENNYDCGVYVMAIAQVLCNAFCERKRGRSTDYAGLVRTTVTPSNVSKMRYTTMELIHSLSANEEDRNAQ